MAHDLKAMIDGHSKTLDALNELRTPLWEAILKELDEDRFAGQASVVGKKMRSAYQRLRAGKVSRVQAIESYQRNLQELRIEYEARSLEALWGNAKLHPSAAEMILALYGKHVIRDRAKLQLETDLYLGWLLKSLPRQAPSDVGTTQQGLGGDPMPPALNTCSAAPYAFHDDRESSQFFSVSDLAMSTPASGGVFVDVDGIDAGGSAAHSFVGADFNIPAGFTNVSVSADIDWNFSGWTYAVGGAAGTGADLWLRIENPAGTVASDNSDSLYSLLSPVIWGNSASGSGQSVINGSIATPDASARTIRVFAGVSAHAEVLAGLSAAAQTIASGTVKKICIMAT